MRSSHCLARCLPRVSDASGIDFSRRRAFGCDPTGRSTEGRVYYIGPRRLRSPRASSSTSSADERVLRPPVLETIAHAYPDGSRRRHGPLLLLRGALRREDPRDGRARATTRPVRHRQPVPRNDLRLYPDAIRAALERSARRRGSLFRPPLTSRPPRSPSSSPTGRTCSATSCRRCRRSQQFLEELPVLFAWLDGTSPGGAAGASLGADEDESGRRRRPRRGAGVPLEAVRFAGWNHLLVELAYQGSSPDRALLAAADAGRRLILHAERADGADTAPTASSRIQGLRTTTPVPTAAPIEFSARGPLHAPPQYRTLVPPASRCWLAFVAHDRSTSTSAPLRPPICPRDAQLFASSTQRPEWLPLQGRSGRYAGRGTDMATNLVPLPELRDALLSAPPSTRRAARHALRTSRSSA